MPGKTAAPASRSARLARVSSGRITAAVRLAAHRQRKLSFKPSFAA